MIPTYSPSHRSAPGPTRTLVLGLVMGTTACGSHPPAEFGAVPAGLRVTVETEFYTVRGLSAHDLDVEMVMYGPDVEGHPRYGATAFQIDWSFTTRSTAAGCVVRRPEVRIEMVVHLPQWQDRQLADEPLRRAWDDFLRAVQTHEDGHQRRSVEGASRIMRALRDARSGGGCAELRRVTERRLRQLLTEIHADNRRYDLETGGGSRSGVRWPPAR